MKKLLFSLCIFLVLFSGCRNQGNPTKEPSPALASETEVASIEDEIEAKKPTPSEKAAESGKRVVYEPFEMLAVRDNNLIEDNGVRTHVVYLPPSYYTSDQSYPVVYYFHGFNGNALNIQNLRLKSDAMMKSGDLKEFIIVSVSYGNSLGGTFLENSPVTGLWEDGFINEFMPYIESTYRVLAKKESRALSGFSMGGYTSTAMAFKHPDLFGVLYGMGPGLLIDGELGSALCTWSDQFKSAYGSAFCPMPERQVKYKVPSMNGHESDTEIIDRWLNGFGHLEEKIDVYLMKETPLVAIGLEVADNDHYEWITNGTYRFSEILTERGIDHTFNVNQIGHTIDSAMFAERAMTFISDHLSFESLTK